MRSQILQATVNDTMFLIKAPLPQQCQRSTYCTLTVPCLAAGIVSLLVVGNHLWAGTADGHVLVWDMRSQTLRSDRNPHTDKVSCLELVGSHVWSGSGDRQIICHDAATGNALYNFGDQGV